MQCGCERTVPGYKEEWGDFSSGLTQRRQENAVRCGYKGVVNRYPGGCASACPIPLPKGGGVPASTALADREKKRLTDCPVEAKPVAKTSQDYTRNLTKNVVECEASLLAGDARFKQYERRFPPACPPVPTEQLNSTLPKPSFTDCQPSRFF